MPSPEEAELKRFIDERTYLDVLSKIEKSGFAAPRKCFISKMHSGKKRVVYIFPREESYILKFLTFLLIRRYDAIFAPNLYSFRTSRGVQRAIRFLKKAEGLSSMFVYKADIHNYFNSVDVDLLLPQLKEIMTDDMETYRLISDLLTDPRVELPDGTISREKKGIMAGVPLSSFLANVYLNALDWHFQKAGITYARYSDDIILFAPTDEARRVAIEYMHACLREMRLEINPSKEELTLPYQKWNFLGISYENGVLDISDVSASKIKMKMRRKSRALLRWKTRKGLDNLCAAKAFVKIFNRKLYDNYVKSELTWTRWFFPVINTTKTLGQIDHYMQDCLRYIATGKRNRSRFRFGYEEMKHLGYRCMVHEYYLIKKDRGANSISKP